jgi:hypothetical protein
MTAETRPRRTSALTRATCRIGRAKSGPLMRMQATMGPRAVQPAPWRRSQRSPRRPISNRTGAETSALTRATCRTGRAKSGPLMRMRAMMGPRAVQPAPWRRSSRRPINPRKNRSLSVLMAVGCCRRARLRAVGEPRKGSARRVAWQLLQEEAEPPSCCCGGRAAKASGEAALRSVRRSRGARARLARRGSRGLPCCLPADLPGATRPVCGIACTGEGTRGAPEWRLRQRA